MSNSNIKPGEMEDIVPEEVSAVETPAVPEAGFVVLNKSETPEPESTEDSGGVSEESFPLQPDASSVEKAQETLEVLEPQGSASDVTDVIAKALVDLKLNLDGLSDIQKGQLLDLAIAVAPEEEDDMAEDTSCGEGECVAGEDGMCKACGKAVEKACATDKACKTDMEKDGNVGVQLNEQIFKMNTLLEQLIQKQAVPELSDEEILAKAEEVKLRKAAEAQVTVVSNKHDAQIEELAGQVARLTKALGRACGQDT